MCFSTSVHSALLASTSSARSWRIIETTHDKLQTSRFMLTAFLWGTGAAVSLLVGSLIVLKWDIPCRVVGLVMAFGVGVLISAVSFELVDEAIHLDKNHLLIASGFLLGSLTFFIGNLLLEKIWQLTASGCRFHDDIRWWSIAYDVGRCHDARSLP